jgi:hypothetical protein
MASAPLVSGSYEPCQLKALGKAFDDVWARVGHTFGNRRVAVETARIMLAAIMFGLARHGNFDRRWLADNATELLISRASACAKERVGRPA